MPDPREHLARRVATDPAFLAWALAGYARGEGLDDAGLAAALGCPVPTLTTLRLCRLPAADPPAFRQDIDRIAGRFGVDADVLAEAVRRAQALRRLQGGAARGTLLAARDDDRPAEEGEPPGGKP